MAQLEDGNQVSADLEVKASYLDGAGDGMRFDFTLYLTDPSDYFHDYGAVPGATQTMTLGYQP